MSEVAPAGARPAWSPDGARIAFLHEGRIVTRLMDGTGEQTLPVSATGVKDFAWSPDGQWLALWVADRIELASVDGSSRDIVAEEASGGAEWAPDDVQVRSAAPKLTVRTRPRLDRRGRATLRATCDRSCVVKLRLRLKLDTGRTVDGRAATASAPAGGAVRLRLSRGKVPPKRRIASARIVGKVRGPDGRERTFTQSVRR